jgi:hypothetical protein
VVEEREVGHQGDDTLTVGVSRNGKQSPPRPRIEVRQANASPEEAAAITGAIEQFLRDTTPPRAAGGTPVNPWLRTALFEGVGFDCEEPDPWGDPVPWGGQASS